MLGCYRVLDCTGELGWLAGRLLADLGADVVKLESPQAPVDAAAWRAYNVNKRLLRIDRVQAARDARLDALLAAADVLIETAPPGDPTFAPERLRERHPRLVHVSVTPFGHTGPMAHWQASDLEIMAAGGAMSLAGEPDGKPLRISVSQAQGWAGTQAAAGALVALVFRQSTGRGQHVDVSAQAAVLAALAHAPTFVDLADEVPTRGGAFITGRTITGARLRAFWQCRDGAINFVLYGGPAGRRSNIELVDWMRTAAADPGALGDIDFAHFDPKLLDQEEVDRLEAPVARFFATLTKREFLEEASRREMLGYPVQTVADIAADPQLAARGFWADVDGPDGRSERHCGAFARIDGVRAPLRHAPGTPVDFAVLLRAWTAPPDMGGAPRARAGVTSP